MKNETVNLFFACDDGYIPFLSATLTSIILNSNPDRNYHARILHTGISKSLSARILRMGEYLPNFKIEFCDISDLLHQISDKLYTRDYYSKSTYYRLFIPRLFRDIQKALYLDCDIVLCDDVAKLYDTDLRDNLVGAVTDAFVASTRELYSYVLNRIGVGRVKDYFNAGVLLMNLSEMRDFDFENKFLKLLSSVKFEVAQDQDYLNILTYGRRLEIECKWNCMPDFCERICTAPSLIHYNLDRKPWQRDNIQFSDIFWKYAELSPFRKEIRAIKAAYREKISVNMGLQKIVQSAEQEGSDVEENNRIRKLIFSILNNIIPDSVGV